MVESLGNLGDFIGGIGVIITLIYLATQVRQNTAALRAASRQAIVAGMRDHSRQARSKRRPARPTSTSSRHRSALRAAQDSGG